MRFIFSALLFLSFVFISTQSLAAETSPTPGKPIRVLFIGNSLTMNNNLPFEVASIGASMTSPVKIETAMVATGGYTLEKHWKGDKAVKKIQEGGWDFVVLQEHSYTTKGDPTSTDPTKNFSPLDKADLTKEYARKFDTEIKKVNAKGMLYSTWALQKSPEDQAAITAIHTDLAKELNDIVVPVAQARANAVKGDATWNFFVKDGKHPTQPATYLAACTFFKAITGQSSKNNLIKITDPKDPKKILLDITAEQASYLQKIADETVTK